MTKPSSFFRPVFLLLLATLWAGCYTTTPERPHPYRPARERPAPHYRPFDGADDLAAYLRVDSEAGPLVSAHRGGPASGYPENALATFERTLRYAPALIECGVRMTRDSVLVLMHDATLDRTTTGEGPVDRHTLAALRSLRLVDNQGRLTPFRLPTLAEALAWAEGRAVLTLDVKEAVPPRRVVDLLDRFDAYDRAVVITYSAADAARYHRLAAELVLSVTTETIGDVQAHLNRGIAADRMIAFTGVGAVNPDLVAFLHTRNIRAILGTFGDIDEQALHEGPEVYARLIDRGIDVIATDVVPLAARATRLFEPAGATP